jgi:hypothetical protein
MWDFISACALRRFAGGALSALWAISTHTNLQAQTWIREPSVRVCEHIVTCDDERDIDLTDGEVKFVETLLKRIPARSTQSVATRFFGRGPLSATDPALLDLGRWKGKIYRATWLTGKEGESTLDSHVDVYFFDGQAYMLKWWSAGMKKMIQMKYLK